MPRSWNGRQRFMRWLKLLGIAVPLAFGMAAAGISTGKWFWTRASTDDIVMLEAKKEDKAHAKEQRAKIEKHLDEIKPVLGNVRDNLLILMDRQRVRPKPLPAHLNDDLLERLNEP